MRKTGYDFMQLITFVLKSKIQNKSLKDLLTGLRLKNFCFIAKVYFV